MLSVFWKYGCAGLLVVSLLLGLALAMERRASAKKDARIVKLTAELTRISTERNEQRETTKRTIAETRVIYRDTERRAERVERAPVAPNCATPDAILESDL